MGAIILIPGFSWAFLLGSHKVVGHPAGVLELSAQFCRCNQSLEIWITLDLRNYTLLENFLEP